MRELTSRYATFVLKCVLPAAVLGFSAILGAQASGGAELFVILAIACVVLLPLLWFARALKTVMLDGTVLVISDVSRSIRVDLADVDRVSGSTFMNPEVIWIDFKEPTPFGSRVVFIPPQRLIRGFLSHHPMVDELEAQRILASPSPRA